MNDVVFFIGLFAAIVIAVNYVHQDTMDKRRNETNLLIGRERNEANQFLFNSRDQQKLGALEDKKDLLVNAKILQEIKSLSERLQASESGRVKLAAELEALKSQQQPVSKTVVVVADQDDSRVMDPAENADHEVAAGIQIEPDDLATYDEQANGHVS